MAVNDLTAEGIEAWATRLPIANRTKVKILPILNGVLERAWRHTHVHLPMDDLSTRIQSRRMGKRSRTRESAPKAPAPAGDRMARVAVADDVWTDFRALAGDRSIAQALGALVKREVERERARRVKAGQLDDRELVDALSHAREQYADLAALVDRLERRINDRSAAASDPGRQRPA